MAPLVIDENLPRSLAPALRPLGYGVKDVRDEQLRGQPDTRIYEFAQKEQAVLVSGDLGFANLVRFPLGSHQRVPSRTVRKYITRDWSGTAVAQKCRLHKPL